MNKKFWIFGVLLVIGIFIILMIRVNNSVEIKKKNLLNKLSNTTQKNKYDWIFVVDNRDGIYWVDKYPILVNKNLLKYSVWLKLELREAKREEFRMILRNTLDKKIKDTDLDFDYVLINSVIDCKLNRLKIMGGYWYTKDNRLVGKLENKSGSAWWVPPESNSMHFVILKVCGKGV